VVGSLAGLVTEADCSTLRCGRDRGLGRTRHEVDSAPCAAIVIGDRV